MFKKFLVFFAAMYMAVSFAAVDVNKATAAELDSIKGIGPSISSKIIDERKKGTFKDWNDFIQRVKGIGTGNAAKFSAAGMTVDGSDFKGTTTAATPTKKDSKSVAKTDEKKTDSKSAITTPSTTSSTTAPKVESKSAVKDAKVEAPKPAASAAKK